MSVSCGKWEGGLAIETEKTQSHGNAQKTQCVPTVSGGHEVVSEMETAVAANIQAIAKYWEKEE